jgi:hypothetical protein
VRVEQTAHDIGDLLQVGAIGPAPAMVVIILSGETLRIWES